jgi:hypothetical protein
MTYLELLLLAKIVVTGLFVSLPFLLFTQSYIDRATGAERGSVAIYRLYGWAVLALLTGYTYGFWQANQGIFPEGVVIMGLVSNAGAATLLVLTRFVQRQIALTMLLGIVALGLAIALLNPAAAMQHAF